MAITFLNAGWATQAFASNTAIPLIRPSFSSFSLSRSEPDLRDLDAPAVVSSDDLGGTRKVVVTLKKGDTLNSALTAAGVSATAQASAITALGDLYDPMQVSTGDELDLTMRPNLRNPRISHLMAMTLRSKNQPDLTLVTGPDGALRTAVPDQAWSVDVVSRTGSISGDVLKDLASAQVPASVAREVQTAFEYDPAIPSRPKKGSRFTVVYESAVTAGSGSRGLGQTQRLRYASLVVRGREHRVYRYETNAGAVAFVNPQGEGVMPIRLGKVIDSKEMTSGWGWRIHPVLKRKIFHKGLDFRAPRGTPVYAAEDGVVSQIGWRGNYGRLVTIAHSAAVSTNYAHLNGFAPGLHEGSRVKKGQVVAYVGHSGLATGNHLYYEVVVNGKQVDPGRRDLGVKIDLAGSSLNRFQTYVATISDQTTEQ
ncbi:MAG: M23 family metallopeptidase [Parvibaculaceae bacterium]|nr:M23 family metallopeptidase [Parvibaculaceae bacterium]